MEQVLRVSNLEVELNGQRILERVSFELCERETLVVLGRNGAGKTVLLRALLGLVPFRGEVHWRDRSRIGFVPQRVPLQRNLPVTVGDFFAMKKVAHPRAIEALVSVGLSDRAILKKQLGELSSGQFQRTLIAWALARDPQVLILDEPNAGVDVEGGGAIHALLGRERTERGVSMIWVTHDLSVISEHADRVLCLYRGVSHLGAPEEALSRESLRATYGTEVKYFRHAHG